jgi:hypothetical protein
MLHQRASSALFCDIQRLNRSLPANFEHILMSEQETNERQQAAVGNHTGVDDEAATAEVAQSASAMFCGLTMMTALKLLVVILLITGIVLGLTVGDLDSRLGTLLRWLEDNRLEGILIYIALYTVLTGAFENCMCSAAKSCRY